MVVYIADIMLNQRGKVRIWEMSVKRKMDLGKQGTSNIT